VRGLLQFKDMESENKERPRVLYCSYFNLPMRVVNKTALPSRIVVTSDPDNQVDCDSCVQEAQRIFASICPGEEFLPQVPNPEDILWEDDGPSMPQEESAGQGGEQSMESSNK